jgi:hypothetical protein
MIAAVKPVLVRMKPTPLPRPSAVDGHCAGVRLWTPRWLGEPVESQDGENGVRVVVTGYTVA